LKSREVRHLRIFKPRELKKDWPNRK